MGQNGQKFKSEKKSKNDFIIFVIWKIKFSYKLLIFYFFQNNYTKINNFNHSFTFLFFYNYFLLYFIKKIYLKSL